MISNDLLPVNRHSGNSASSVGSLRKFFLLAQENWGTDGGNCLTTVGIAGTTSGRRHFLLSLPGNRDEITGWLGYVYRGGFAVLYSIAMMDLAHKSIITALFAADGLLISPSSGTTRTAVQRASSGACTSRKTTPGQAGVGDNGRSVQHGRRLPPRLRYLRQMGRCDDQH